MRFVTAIFLCAAVLAAAMSQQGATGLCRLCDESGFGFGHAS
jgi:hypothetical protein